MDALDIHYDKFEELYMGRLNERGPKKEKIVRANNAPFTNKILSKAVMTRSRLHNKYINMPTEENERNYKTYRNYCVNLFRRGFDYLSLGNIYSYISGRKQRTKVKKNSAVVKHTLWYSTGIHSGSSFI